MAVTLLLAGTNSTHCRFRTSVLAELSAYLHAVTYPSHHPASGETVTRAYSGLSSPLVERIKAWSPLWGPHRARFLLPLRENCERSFDDELEDIRNIDLETFVASVAKCTVEVVDTSGDDLDGPYMSEILSRTARLSEERAAVMHRVLENPDAIRTEVVDLLHEAGTSSAFMRDWKSNTPQLRGEVAYRNAELDRIGPKSIADISTASQIKTAPDRIVFDKLYHAIVKAREQPLVMIPSVHVEPHIIVKHTPDLPIVVQYPVSSNSAVPFDLLLKRIRAMDDPLRIQICRIILREPRATVDIARRLDVAESQVSRHLRALRDAELVYSERQGKLVRYHMDTDAVGHVGLDFIANLIR